MIYNTRNQSNDTTESQREKKNCFNIRFQYSHLKITGPQDMVIKKGSSIEYVRNKIPKSGHPLPHCTHLYAFK